MTLHELLLTPSASLIVLKSDEDDAIPSFKSTDSDPSATSSSTPRRKTPCCGLKGLIFGVWTTITMLSPFTFTTMANQDAVPTTNGVTAKANPDRPIPQANKRSGHAWLINCLFDWIGADDWILISIRSSNIHILNAQEVKKKNKNEYWNGNSTVFGGNGDHSVDEHDDRVIHED